MSAAPLLAVARTINRPTIIVPGRDPEEFGSFEAVVDRIHEIAGGRPIEIAPGWVDYPDLDGFHAVRIRQGGGLLATYGDRWTERERDQRLATLRSLFS